MRHTTHQFIARITRSLCDESGAALVEWGSIVALVSIVAIGLLTVIGGELPGPLQAIAEGFAKA